MSVFFLATPRPELLKRRAFDRCEPINECLSSNRARPQHRVNVPYTSRGQTPLVSNSDMASLTPPYTNFVNTILCSLQRGQHLTRVKSNHFGLTIQLTRTACLTASIVDSRARVPRSALSSTLFTVLSSEDTFATIV